jgi:hypothetical protein
MDAGVAHMMPPPSPPAAAPRSLASTAPPDAIGSLTEQATAELNVKREQLKLAMMELDLAERREKIATAQAERALAIKERELELAERERRLNPPPPPPAPPPPPPEPEVPRPDLRVSSEMGVSIPPARDSQNGKKRLAMSSEMNVGNYDPREEKPPYVRAPSVRDENRAENAPPTPTRASAADGKENGTVDANGGGASDVPPGTGAINSDVGRNQDINSKLARMHSHKDHLKEEYLSKLDELDKQMAEAAIAQHKREILAEKVAEQAVRDAKMTRVTQLANLIAASLEMVKKSGDALDHVVLKLVDHLEQETAEEMALNDPSIDPLADPADTNEDLQGETKQTLQQKLMSLMTSTPTTEQLEEAVGMIEGLKPKGEWDTMASLGANLTSLQNFMREMDGKATEEEEALAIANAVLAAEGKEEQEGEGGEEGEEGEPDAPEKPASEKAPEEPAAAEEPAELPVPPELADKLNTLRGKKKYLEEIRELELQVRALQEQAAAGFPPEVEPPEVFPEGEEGADGEEGAAEGAEPAAEPA